MGLRRGSRVLVLAARDAARGRRPRPDLRRPRPCVARRRARRDPARRPARAASRAARPAALRDRRRRRRDRLPADDLAGAQAHSSAHASVVVGLLPAATAAWAVARAGERPSRAFWLAAAAGLVAVLAFAATQGVNGIEPADLLVLAAVALGGLGYAEGGALSRSYGGWQVICWALVLTAPFIALPVTLAAATACTRARPPGSASSTSPSSRCSSASSPGTTRSPSAAWRRSVRSSSRSRC